MGEYAIRKSDDVEIKIGTCESMYYIRYEDRNKVRQMAHSLDASTCEGLFWRLPFADEDHLQPGEYESSDRGQRLYKEDDSYGDGLAEDLTEQIGIIQLHHKSGLLINVPCYHGNKLPEPGPRMKTFWNGKSWSLELTSIKNTPEGVLPVVSCRHCHSMWRFTWDEIMPYLHGEMKQRLSQYQSSEVAA